MVNSPRGQPPTQMFFGHWGGTRQEFLRTSAWEAATPKVLRICLLTLALNEKEFEYLYSDQRSKFQLSRNF